MDPGATLSLLSPLDIVALLLLGGAFLAVGWRIEHPGRARLSVTVMMSEHRREWMRVMLGRDNRIFDSQIMGMLRQGTAFFASTSLISIGGLLALIGNPAPLEGVAEGFIGDGTPEILWQAKLMLVLLFLAHAFLRFVWANRLFGYCAVLIAAVPNQPGEGVNHRAVVAGEINVRAAMNFNRGLRAVYFALAALAWLLGPVALAIATAAVTWVLWSREFRSEPQRLLAGK
ncbi:DUF599 domain-containing protein [Wenxinia saemankumensis]|uniref:Uncharacterized membrane protein n=1 Tax=Wenxinia saemankumensis TaxID=1447782 RepID=A0A1M6GUE5_9RHOB|nr:DUF599 domain-containing protein [Wenxinia saemankumensis]SHJ13535.1 Uncharacterized membrane protein [Wenxinia saemankumensis]